MCRAPICLRTPSNYRSFTRPVFNNNLNVEMWMGRFRIFSSSSSHIQDHAPPQNESKRWKSALLPCGHTGIRTHTPHRTHRYRGKRFSNAFRARRTLALQRAIRSTESAPTVFTFEQNLNWFAKKQKPYSPDHMCKTFRKHDRSHVCTTCAPGGHFTHWEIVICNRFGDYVLFESKIDCIPSFRRGL